MYTYNIIYMWIIYMSIHIYTIGVRKNGKENDKWLTSRCFSCHQKTWFTWANTTRRVAGLCDTQAP